MCIHRSRSTCLLVLTLLGGATQASAYTDPGSGAFLWQILVGGITGCLFYFRRAAVRFSRPQGKVAETGFGESEDPGR